MVIKQNEDCRKRGRPFWFTYLPEGMPGENKEKEQLSHTNHSQKALSPKSQARASLQLIIPKEV